MKIGELTRATGLSVETIRYCASSPTFETACGAC